MSADRPRSTAAPTRRDASGFRFGFWIALATSGTTVVTFALALTALPDKVPYPFTSEVIARQWPGDYYWMFPAMLLMLVFVALLAAVHESAAPEGRLYSRLAFGVGAIAASVLLIDYYIQATVMPISLEKGQLEGWAMLTQYNPNGAFIALEELGYLLMSVVFLCLVPVFRGGSHAERGVRWLFLLSFGSAVLSLVVVSAVRGIDRADVFEIAIITIVWLTLIVGGLLLSRIYRRGVHSKATGQAPARVAAS
jgi:hypothetical protein